MSADLSGFDWVRNGEAVIVTDSSELQSILQRRGVATQSLLELAELPPRSLVLSFSKEASRHTFEIATRGRQEVHFCALHVLRRLCSMRNMRSKQSLEVISVLRWLNKKSSWPSSTMQMSLLFQAALTQGKH
nr:hypothetical protein [Pseudomonas sp. BIGb0427]